MAGTATSIMDYRHLSCKDLFDIICRDKHPNYPWRLIAQPGCGQHCKRSSECGWCSLMWKQEDEQSLENELEVRKFMREEKLKQRRSQQGPFYGTKKKRPLDAAVIDD